MSIQKAARALSLIIGIFFTASVLFPEMPQEKSLQTDVDFSGVDKFLELTALLERDIEPTPKQWNEMFATPGYEVLIRREFKNGDFFADRIRLAFMPSKKDELETRLQEEEGWIAQFLRHFVRAKKERQVIVDAVEGLKKMSFVQDAVEEARLYLPEFQLDSYPPISFVVFGPDARGYVPVVLDIFYTLERRKWLVSFVAHEFHHFYRDRFFDFGQDQQILWVINQIQAEGIADQVNVGKWFHDEELYAVESQNSRNKPYLDWYAKSPEIIKEMDRLFSLMFDSPELKGKLGAQLQELVPQSGHPTGFFMANMILEQLGKEALIDTVKNPFAFFLIYKKAADEKGASAPTFSDKAMNFIRLLEKRYFYTR